MFGISELHDWEHATTNDNSKEKNFFWTHVTCQVQLASKPSGVEINIRFHI